MCRRDCCVLCNVMYYVSNMNCERSKNYGPNCMYKDFGRSRGRNRNRNRGAPKMSSSSKKTYTFPRFILFGDSITQQSFSPSGWGASLANHYSPAHVDIVLRGFSGYNTRWALFLLPQIFPQTPLIEPPLLVTIFFGANDAVLPDHIHNEKHVPLQEYKENLRKIISHIRSISEATHVVLLTPPPVHKKGLQIAAVEKYGANIEDPPSRSNEVTGTYARACIEIGRECRVSVIDLWSSMQQESIWETRFLSDGLHLSPEGNSFVANQLLQLLDNIGLSAGGMKTEFPDFLSIDASEPKNSFK